MKASAFLGIPFELRCQIYEYCLVNPDPIFVRHLLGYPYTSGSSRERPPHLHTNLLRVSKQISHEAMEVFCGSNTFLLFLESGAIHSLEYVFTSTNRLRIRKLQLVIKDNDQLWQSIRFRSQLWDPILARLKKLTLVVEPPPWETDPERRIMSKEVMEHQRLGNWLNWVGPMVGYIGDQLPSSVNIEVDDDGREEIDDLMKETFTAGYRKVRTGFGDKLFKRASGAK
jgi:hypothetical protein